MKDGGWAFDIGTLIAVILAILITIITSVWLWRKYLEWKAEGQLALKKLAVLTKRIQLKAKEKFRIIKEAFRNTGQNDNAIMQKADDEWPEDEANLDETIFDSPQRIKQIELFRQESIRRKRKIDIKANKLGLAHQV